MSTRKVMVERFDFSKMQDDETYIYIDKVGNLQKGLDFTVTWIGDSDKSVLITASPSDTLDYLKVLIGEAMSKYHLFEGLTQLVARRLQDEKGNFIRVEREIGSNLRTGQKLFCELVASDLWIDVRLNVPKEKLKIMFEVRVSCTATNELLKKHVFKCAIDVLRQMNLEAGYYLSHIYLYRFSPNVYEEALMGKTILPAADNIGDTFDFRSRYVTGVLNYVPNYSPPAVLGSSSSSLSSDDSLEAPERQAIKPLVTRNLHTERMQENSNTELKRLKSVHLDSGKCVDCTLW